MHRTTLDLFHGFTRVIKVRHLVHHKCVRSLARSKSTVYITKTGFLDFVPEVTYSQY